MACEIGAQKYTNGLDPFTHKVLHGIVGGLGAKLEGSDFASGALGAVVAETVAELVDDYDSYKPIDDVDHPILGACREDIEKKAQELGRPLTLGEANSCAEKTFRRIAHERGAAAAFGRFAALGVAFGFNKDVAGADRAAENAIKNNWVQAIAAAEGFLATAQGQAFVASLGVVVSSIVMAGDECLTPLRDFAKQAVDAVEFVDAEEAYAALLNKAHRDGDKQGKEDDHDSSGSNGNHNGHNGDKAAGLAGLTILGKNLKTYIKEMQRRSGLKIPQNQRDLLARAVREKKFKRLEGADKAAHRSKFTEKKRNELISEWENGTGQKWPKYQKVDKITGEKLIDKKTGLPDMQPAQAHHIIPQQNGGPHTWWNMHPLTAGKHHQGGVHGSGSILNQMLKEVR